MTLYHQTLKAIENEQWSMAGRGEEASDKHDEEQEQDKQARVKQLIYEQLRDYDISLDEKLKLGTEVYTMLRGYGSLQPLLEDDRISEIMIIGQDRLYIEKAGKIRKIDHHYYFDDELSQIVQRMVGRLNKQVNEKNPICDVSLEQGERVNIVLAPVVSQGPVVTIRKFPKQQLTLEDLVDNQTVTREAADFLKQAVACRYNLFISGGTSSGKTTLLNILAAGISPEERIITIEDARELQIRAVDNQVNLVTRESSFAGSGEITMQELIRSALRMRPDRIVVGEVRGKEAIDMIQAMNTGHDGSLSTGHANSVADMVKRLETMVLAGLEIPLLAIRQQIASAVELFVHVEKIHQRGRRVTEITEVIGMVEGQVKLNRLYDYDIEKDQLVRTETDFERCRKQALFHQTVKQEVSDDN